MNPRAVAAWSLAALTVALSTDNPVYRGMVLLAALNVLAAFRRDEVRVRPLLLAIAIAAATSLLVTTVFSHTGVHVLLRIPASVPGIGGDITVEAVVFGVTTGLGVAAAIAAAATLSLVIAPHELVDALPRALARSGAALGTALNLVPGMARSATEIRDAQRMRGWRPRRARDWPDIAVPIVLTALESSLTLAEAMEARGYGSGARTHFAASRWRLADTTVAAVALLAAAGFVVLRVTGAIADWYPFPDVTAPPLDLAAAACCLLMGAPLVAWRRAA